MELISTLEGALGRTAEKNMLPMQPGDVPATYADVEALVQDVGFAPKTPIADGVHAFVQWYRSYYNIGD
jgi:UDP-glucuronate 4-epimerase